MSIFLKIFIAVLLSSSIQADDDNHIWSKNHKLRTDLLKSYDKGALPHLNSNGTTTVYVYLYPRAILIDDAKETLIVNSYLLLDWLDKRLTWDSKDYGNLEMIHFGDSELWKPDLAVYNNADITEIDHYGNTHFLVYPNGWVFWFPPAQMKTYCPIDLSYWPFDEHTCKIRYGSWTSHGLQLDLELWHNITELSLGGYVNISSGWSVLEATQHRITYPFLGYEEFFVEIVFWFTLKRNTPTFAYCLIAPCIMFPLLLLTQFILPVDHDKRLTIGCTGVILVFLQLVFFKTIIPRVGGSIPIIGVPFIFPTFTQRGDVCAYLYGGSGRCLLPQECPSVQYLLHSRNVRYMDVQCPFSRYNHLVCCKYRQQGRPRNAYLAKTLISSPDNIDKECGVSYFDSSSDIRDIYRLNETAEELSQQGFSVNATRVIEDRIIAYEYSNLTFTGNEKGEGQTILPIVLGGQDARRVLGAYMAIIGDHIGWFCNGVLINRNWIMTAAHCFKSGRNPEVIRLGEYDVGSDVTSATEYPLDFQIQHVVIHPEYKAPTIYHDLALVKLDRRAPYFREDITPICLPWARESNRNHVNNEVTLTGWGARDYRRNLLSFSHDGPNILQEVNVTVFNPTFCDQNYATLPDYRERFPLGITSEMLLCAGSRSGGKDACQGDSGGPLVYVDEEQKYTLLGIVSVGYQCGLQNFPGIYIPINKNRYLGWIKKIAF